MIHGIGTDIVEVARLARMLDRHGDRVASRILAPEEQAEFSASVSPARFLAKRFAMKEAFAKALGTGIRASVGLRSVAIVHDDMGKPLLAFGASLAERMREDGLVAHVSVSDEDAYVVAFAVVETDAARGR